MSVTDIFSDDPQEERLASHFEELYQYLLDEGVPEECLPSPWHMLRRVVKAVDHAKIQDWLDAYAEVEADPESYVPEENSPEPVTAAPPRSGRRSYPYLRALDGQKSSEDQEDDDETEPSDG